jgi:hypothetical protein
MEGAWCILLKAVPECRLLPGTPVKPLDWVPSGRG